MFLDKNEGIYWISAEIYKFLNLLFPRTLNDVLHKIFLKPICFVIKKNLFWKS